MLLIHKSQSTKKLFFLVITSICIIGALLGLSALTYTPELSHAEEISVIPKDTRTIMDVTYMQDVTPDVCNRSAAYDSKQLIDIRDNKAYWIAKLADGNCWMTQNLALNIPETGLSARDTDIEIDWNETTNPTYPPQATKNKISFYGDSVVSYNPGERFCNKSTCRIGSINQTSENNGHDAQGNYYTFNAVTAGTGASTKKDGDIASGSICPKNWRLPLSGASCIGSDATTYVCSNDAIEGSFRNLFIKSKLQTETTTNSPDLIVDEPFYFMYTGVMSGSQLIQSNGNQGYYWSSVNTGRYNATNVYGLNLFENEKVILPSDSSLGTKFGYPARCVVISGNQTNKNITVTTKPTISLDVALEAEVEKTETNPSMANLDVKVSSNQKYSVGISATNPDLTSSTNSTTIPAKSGLLNTAENGWGIKLKDNTEFTALTSTLQTFYTASGAEIKTIPFTIGISTAPDIPNGEYSTNITVTATQN